MEFYGHAGGALNVDLDEKLANALDDPKKDGKEEEKKKSKLPWHRRLNRAVDKALTHPIVEAGKTAARFVPGVGIFMIGVDRLTKWKLTYSSNESLVAMLEKKMTDITVTYISLVELLPPAERRDDNPRLKIFARRADQVKKLVAFIQKAITDYNAKSEKEKLGMAEVIQSSFNALQKVLDELQRDIQLHLGIQSSAALHAQDRKLDNMVKVLVAQRSVLENQADKNEKLLSLMTRQIQANDHIAAAVAQLKDDLTPGYAKVANLEIRRVWWDFFRWPAAQPTNDFLSQMPQYFKMQRDPVALQMWTNMQRGVLLRVDDLGVEQDGLVTPFDLNEVFPYDPVYEISIGDWLIWKGLGWIFLAAEIERKLLPFRNKFIQCPTVVGKFITYLSDTLNALRKEHGYNATMHARLLDISVRIVSSALPAFSDRFQSFLEALTDAFDVIDGAYTDSTAAWFDVGTVQALVQSLSTMQWRLAAAAEDLGVTGTALWDADELQAWTTGEEELTQWAHALGNHYATTVWNAWNGTSALISPHALAAVQKLGGKTLKATYQYQPVVLRPLALSTAGNDAYAPVEAAARCATYNVCRAALATHGVTLYANCWMAVVEYCERGDLRAFLANRRNAHLPLASKIRIALQATAAVRFLHDHAKTPHRRLTSSHIYITDGITPKVGGLLPAPVDADVLRYRAPECLDGEAADALAAAAAAENGGTATASSSVDWHAGDVFSIAHILLEILRGAPPHAELTDAADVRRAVLDFAPGPVIDALPSSLPSDLTQLLRSALSADLIDRPTLAEFHDTLESIHVRLRQEAAPSGTAAAGVDAGEWFSDAPPAYGDAMTLGRSNTTGAGAAAVAASFANEDLAVLVARAAVPNEDLHEIEAELNKLATVTPRALLHLGDLYYFDHSARGFPHDFNRALTVYSSAVDAGDPLAAVGVADCHYFGHGGVAKSPGVARDLYAKAVAYADRHPDVTVTVAARAHAGLGDVMYDQGEYPTALEHYYRATELDPACKRAWARIGDSHLFGRGTSVDPDHARKCYRKAKGTRREVEGMIEYYRNRGEYAFANMYLNDQLLYYPDY
ncbi:Receptor-interacting serine/threonine-protein kinase 3 [Blastocladiella emersonii ATCC 22665]|nr:Receptor-interacting serine/threonine-protein kinase 3 [Blastocladiella emersonii ATCC 22665]